MMTILRSAHINLLIYLRVKTAVFFTLFFPVLIFFLFGSIWGGKGNTGYIYFLLSGIVGMTVASQGFFSIGSLLREYHQHHALKYLKALPMSISKYFIGLILSRMIIMLGIILALSLAAGGFFQAFFAWSFYLRLLAGSLVGLMVFSFMGLILSFYGGYKERESHRGLISLVYFIMLFTSNAFYPIDEMNSFIYKLSQMFPLAYLLDFFRGEEARYSLFILLSYSLALCLAFVWLYKKVPIKR